MRRKGGAVRFLLVVMGINGDGLTEVIIVIFRVKILGFTVVGVNKGFFLGLSVLTTLL